MPTAAAIEAVRSGYQPDIQPGYEAVPPHELVIAQYDRPNPQMNPALAIARALNGRTIPGELEPLEIEIVEANQQTESGEPKSFTNSFMHQFAGIHAFESVRPVIELIQSTPEMRAIDIATRGADHNKLHIDFVIYGADFYDDTKQQVREEFWRNNAIITKAKIDRLDERGPVWDRRWDDENRRYVVFDFMEEQREKLGHVDEDGRGIDGDVAEADAKAGPGLTVEIIDIIADGVIQREFDNLERERDEVMRHYDALVSGEAPRRKYTDTDDWQTEEHTRGYHLDTDPNHSYKGREGGYDEYNYPDLHVAMQRRKREIRWDYDEPIINEPADMLLKRMVRNAIAARQQAEQTKSTELLEIAA